MTLVECRHGRFLANANDTYIGTSLIEYGEYSEAEVQLLLQLVPEGGVVIEAGANVGATAVPLARRVGRGGLVHAFEPQPLIFQQLCANLALNEIYNVAAVNAGCGETPAVIGITRLDPARQGNFGGVTLDSVTTDRMDLSVPVVRLDDATAPHRLDLIKADVEGMELAVLKGAAGLIGRFRPPLYVEIHDPDPALLAHIAALGYRCWWHLPPLFAPDNFGGNADNRFGDIRSINVVAIAAERTGEINGLREVTGPEDHPRRWA